FYLWGTDLYGVGTGVGVNINIQPSANTPIPGAIYDTLGNDSLIGGDEDNIFFYTGGKDVLQEVGGIDVLRFSNGITFNQVGSGLMKSGNDLILKVNGSSANQVTLKNYFLAGNNLVETIDFETGGQLTAEQIFGAFGLTIPTTGGGTQPANPVGDTIYSYTAGELTINEQSGTDKVIFKNGITFSQVGNYLSKSGDDLVLKINGSNTNKVTVKNFFLAGNSLVENFEFETGGALTAQQIFDAFGLTLPSTGGSGNQGSSEVVGDTTYNYTSGALTITEQSGNDKVIFKNGITFNQVGSYLTKSGDDLILKVNGSNTNKVTVKNFFLAGEYLVETFQFETGGQ
ncbi:MAG: calcium-binding protein, partial [Pseudomonadota bacterium]|nr:calcium-binding protein [Pseudomonadota bacterium]